MLPNADDSGDSNESGSNRIDDESKTLDTLPHIFHQTAVEAYTENQQKLQDHQNYKYVWGKCAGTVCVCWSVSWSVEWVGFVNTSREEPDKVWSGPPDVTHRHPVPWLTAIALDQWVRWFAGNLGMQCRPVMYGNIR